MPTEGPGPRLPGNGSDQTGEEPGMSDPDEDGLERTEEGLEVSRQREEWEQATGQ